jgi:lipopolysaccharide export system protein LptA
LSFDWLLGQANIRNTSNERVVSPATAKSIDARKFELGNAPGVPRMVESESLKLVPGPARRALPNALAGSLSEALPSTTPDYATAIEINADSTRYENDVAIAEGHAVFNDGKAKITGNALRYDPKKREVEVTGSARIEQGGNVVTSEKIIYQLDTGKIQTVGPSKTTVQATPAR